MSKTTDQQQPHPSDTFQITLSRQGITPQEEAATTELSKQMQLCATQIVDKAAQQSGLTDRRWARRVALYQAYHRSLLGKKDDDSMDKAGESNNSEDPLQAALRLLVDEIGSFPDNRKDSAVKFAATKLFTSCKQELLDQVNPELRRAFLQELVVRCRNEQKRLCKPVTYSVTVSLGDPQAIAARLKQGGSAACHVGAMESAIHTATTLEPPEGCSQLAIAVRGAKDFCFSTQCAESDKEQALRFLETAKAKAVEAWGIATVTKVEEPFTKEEASDESNDEGLQPSLNIGLIGDVANGKSTLIHAMSGKRTQAHSSEQQKHGMTIRLGFANAAILRCCDFETCGFHSFATESDTLKASTLPSCEACGGTTVVARRVSFTDCPGHAELMATMLSGASSFDAVIFAAAANAPCPTPQAKQHLEALKLSRSHISGRIAIAQTKAELLVKNANQSTQGLSAQELLALHATTAKESLKGTVADGALFFPICALSRLGLAPLAEWIASLPVNERPNAQTEAPRLFSVLRSFDVNRPGSFKRLVGGVLGGTVSYSGCFRPGDEIEVRPGLTVGRQTASDGSEEDRPFAVQPLASHLVEVMTGTSKISKASSGGLIALRTTLSPSLCADDQLVGSVAGPKGMLPPVWGPTLFLDEMIFVDVDPVVFHGIRRSKRLPQGGKVRCHAGSASVAGRVQRVSTKHGKLEVKISGPLCAFKGCNVAIETEVPGRSGFYLVAYASLHGGTCCVDGAEAPSTVVSNTRSTLDTYNDDQDSIHRTRFLDELAAREADMDDGGMRVSVCKPQIQREGGAHVVIENFAAIASCLNREPAHLQAYMEREAQLSCARAGEAGAALRVRIRSRGFDDLLSKIIRKYAATFVCCHQCKGAKTELIKNSNHSTELLCRQCNARRFVTKI